MVPCGIITDAVSVHRPNVVEQALQEPLHLTHDAEHQVKQAGAMERAVVHEPCKPHRAVGLDLGEVLVVNDDVAAREDVPADGPALSVDPRFTDLGDLLGVVVLDVAANPTLRQRGNEVAGAVPRRVLRLLHLVAVLPTPDVHLLDVLVDCPVSVLVLQEVQGHKALTDQAAHLRVVVAKRRERKQFLGWITSRSAVSPQSGYQPYDQ
jgi:hypothetical protein